MRVIAQLVGQSGFGPPHYYAHYDYSPIPIMCPLSPLLGILDFCYDNTLTVRYMYVQSYTVSMYILTS